VTNGWSPSKRDQSTANSGIVVELKLEDFKAYAKYGALAWNFKRVSSKGLASSW
jgi:uncharacterized FAD-dependent dehydrogenase